VPDLVEDAHATKPANVVGAVSIKTLNAAIWASHGASDIK
jgi:hypothetical protein